MYRRYCGTPSPFTDSCYVADLPRVLSQPGRRYLARGMPARLDCPADANPPVTRVRWTKNGRPLDDAVDHRSMPPRASWQVTAHVL